MASYYDCRTTNKQTYNHFHKSTQKNDWQFDEVHGMEFKVWANMHKYKSIKKYWIIKFNNGKEILLNIIFGSWIFLTPTHTLCPCLEEQQQQAGRRRRSTTNRGAESNTKVWLIRLLNYNINDDDDDGDDGRLRGLDCESKEEVLK